MELIPRMGLETKYKCSLCGKEVKEGYFLQYHTDQEYEILERSLSGEPEDWFVCEECVGGHCQEPDIWLEILKNKSERGKK